MIVDQFCEAALGALPKLVVVRGFLADHEASASIARLEPDGCGRRGSTAAIEAYPRAHLDERSALREFGRFFVFDAYQGQALVVLEDANGADRDLVSSFSLPDGVPVSGSQNQTDHKHGRQDHGG